MPPIDDTALDTGSQVEYGDNNSATNTAESEARSYGWVPLDDFKGNPEQWRDASEYLEARNNNVGALRKTVEQITRENRDLHAKMDNLGKTHRQMFQMQVKKLKEEHEQQLAFLKAQHRQAVQQGDVETADALSDQMADMKQRGPDLPEPEAQQNNPVPQDPDAWRRLPGVPEWLAQNQWVDTDPELREFADALATQYRAKGDKSEPVELLQKIGAKIRATFKDKFQVQRKQMVGESTPGGARAQAVKGYSSLNAEEKRHCDQFVRDKLGTAEEYIRLLGEYDTVAKGTR